MALLKFSYGPNSEAPKHNGERERERGKERPNPNFFPLEAKRSFEGRRKEGEEEAVRGGCRLTLLPLRRSRSDFGAKNNKFTYRISNHAAFGSANRAAIGRRTKTFKRIKIHVLSCLASLS